HPCIVLIMGLGGQMILWPEAFCQSLIEQGYYVVRFDNRDIGLSSKLPPSGLQKKKLLLMMARFSIGLTNQGAPYTLEDMADDVALMLEQLNIKKCHVIGASMGGMIAQIFTAKYPDTVEKLGLLFTSNNQPFLPPPGLKQLKMLLVERPAQKEEDMIKHNIQLYRLIGSPRYTRFEDVKQVAQRAYNRSYSPMGVLQQFLAILCTGSIQHWDKQIHHPTLVVHGACDKLLPPKHGRAVSRAIQGSKFELIAEMGHDIPPHFIPQLSGLFAQHFKS
ncbi:MAG: alpha/beta hydrolase, partial [Acinetobacter sp.]